MAIGRITYEDKIDSSVNEKDPKYKITAQDMNEIKQVFNESAEDIEFATENLGDYKVENGVIYFKKADGSYNEQGVSLAGQSTILDGNGKVILSGNITPNDNLLTNSDFKSGIINQKGQTSYVGDGSKNFYTIDMWYATKNVTVTVHDGYVNFKNNTTETNYVIQILNEQPDENYCGAVNVKSIVGTCFLRTQDKDFTKLHEDLNLVKGLNTISFNGAVERTGIYLGANASIDIEFIKLEKGSYFTGMPVWNNSEELTKCMAYFRILDLSFTGGLSNGTYMPRQRFLFENIMRKIPSVKHVSTETLYNCSAEIEYVDRFGITLKSTPTSKSDDWAILEYRVELDAYDY